MPQKHVLTIDTTSRGRAPPKAGYLYQRQREKSKMSKSEASDNAMKGTSSNFGRSLIVCHALFSCSAARWAPLPLRLIVGYGFAAHGFAKLLRGSDNFTGLLHAMGLPFPHFLAWLTIVTEIVGGFCIALGVLVPLVSIPMAIVLLVAIFTVHLPYGFSSIKLQAITPNGAHFGEPGFETDLLYLACLVALVLGGCGPFTVDNWLFRKIDAARRATPNGVPD